MFSPVKCVVDHKTQVFYMVYILRPYYTIESDLAKQKSDLQSQNIGKRSFDYTYVDLSVLLT